MPDAHLYRWGLAGALTGGKPARGAPGALQCWACLPHYNKEPCSREREEINSMVHALWGDTERRHDDDVRLGGRQGQYGVPGPIAAVVCVDVHDSWCCRVSCRFQGPGLPPLSTFGITDPGCCRDYTDQGGLCCHVGWKQPPHVPGSQERPHEA